MSEPVFDLLGIAPLLGDRIVYCRCGVQGENGTGLTVAYVCGLDPLMVFEAELGRFPTIHRSCESLVDNPVGHSSPMMESRALRALRLQGRQSG